MEFVLQISPDSLSLWCWLFSNYLSVSCYLVPPRTTDGHRDYQYWIMTVVSDYYSYYPTPHLISFLRSIIGAVSCLDFLEILNIKIILSSSNQTFKYQPLSTLNGVRQSGSVILSFRRFGRLISELCNFGKKNSHIIIFSYRVTALYFRVVQTLNDLILFIRPSDMFLEGQT